MQCFICVSYLFLLGNALPKTNNNKDIAKERSLFHDVINSIKLRAKIPEESEGSIENTVAQFYEEYHKYDDKNDQLLQPSDFEFIPRRNDRVEFPPLRRRVPKNTAFIAENYTLEPSQKDFKIKKDDIVLYIETKNPKLKPNSPKDVIISPPIPSRRPPIQQKKKNQIKSSNKGNQIIDDEDTIADENIEPVAPQPQQRPQNYLFGSSQLGNRDSQMVIKPTVIVNIRGSVTNRDSDIRLEARQNEENDTKKMHPNVFHINQEVNIDRFKESEFDLNTTDFKEFRTSVEELAIPREADDGETEIMIMTETVANVNETLTPDIINQESSTKNIISENEKRNIDSVNGPKSNFRSGNNFKMVVSIEHSADGNPFVVKVE